MADRVQISRLTGNPDRSGWVQVHDFKPEDKDKLQLRGHLFAVISTKRDDGVDKTQLVEAVLEGREILSRFHEEYFGNQDTSVYEALRQAVQKVTEEFRSPDERIEIVSMVLLEDIAYFAVGGGGCASVLREGNLAKILNVDDSGLLKVASGKLKTSDFVVLCTSSFSKTFPAGILKAAISNNEPHLAAETLAPSLHAQEREGSLGVIFVHIANQTGRVLSQIEPVAEFEKPDRAARRHVFSHNVIWARLMGLRSKLKFSRRRVQVPGEGMEGKRIYVHERIGEFKEQRKRVSITVGVVLVLLLLTSIFFGVKQKRNEEFRQSYESDMLRAEHSLEEAITLFPLEPERSRTLFLESKNILEGLQNKGIKDEQLSELISLLNQKQQEILGEFIVEPELFLDLGLLSNGFAGDEMVMSENTLFILDKIGEKVARVTVENKHSEIIAGPSEIDEPLSMAVYDERVFLVQEDGIYEVGARRERVIDKDWDGSVLVYAYASNIYLLEKTTSLIWRYPALEGEFAPRQPWLSDGVEPDLTGSISLQIDGVIWVLTDTGKILKFSAGNPLNFDISSVVPPLEHPILFYTSEQSESVYVLDKIHPRVIVLTKEGDYKVQYISDTFKDAVQIGVSESEHKLFVLTKSRVFSVPLSHL